MKIKKRQIEGIKAKSKKVFDREDIKNEIIEERRENNNQKEKFSKRKSIILKDSSYSSIFNFKKIKKKNKKTIKILKIITLPLSALLFVFLIMSYFNHSVVYIKEKIKKVKLENNIYAQKNPLNNQLGFDIIAVSESSSKIIKANISKIVEESASGEIIIYNNYSSAPQRLLPETRFETPDGLIFKLGKNSIVIPGKIADKPGSITVIIFAEKTGENYNIDFTDFVIPGFREIGLDNKFNKIYGLSKTEMTGGFVGEKKVLNEDDIKIHKDELNIRLKEELVKSIEKQKTDDFILIKDNYKFVFGDIEKEEESDAENIIIKQKGILYGILINKKSLEQFLIKNLLSEDLKENILINNIDDIDVKLISVIEDFYKIKTINLKINEDIFFNWKIDKRELSEDLSKKDKNLFIDIIKNYESIETARLNIFPFWKRNISYKNKIKIKIEN